MKFWRTGTGVYAGASIFASTFALGMLKGKADKFWLSLLVATPYMTWTPGGGGTAPHGAFGDIAIDICWLYRRKSCLIESVSRVSRTLYVDMQ